MRSTSRTCCSVRSRGVTGTIETFIRERPLPATGASHYGRGRPEDPRTPVTNEDYAGMLCEFACGRARDVRGQPHDGRPREPDGVRRLRHPGRAWAGTSSGSTSCASTASSDDRGSGYTTVLGGDRFPHHGTSCPGSGNTIGFEDLVDDRGLRVLRAVAEGAAVRAGLRATRWRGRRCRPRCCARPRSGGWEDGRAAMTVTAAARRCGSA